MLTFAAQTIANSSTTLTPKEPATLTLALIGLGTLAIYAVFSHWRPRRATAAVSAKTSADLRQATAADEGTTRRAA